MTVLYLVFLVVTLIPKSTTLMIDRLLFLSVVISCQDFLFLLLLPWWALVLVFGLAGWVNGVFGQWCPLCSCGLVRVMLWWTGRLV